jgi:2-dehydropantoate 2-reductase
VRVAIIGYGAIGHVIEKALDGRAEIVPIDRTRAPLRANEPPVDVAIISVKTPGTSWAVEVAQHVVASEGAAITIQNGLGNYEALAAAIGERRAAVGVIYVGARLDEDGVLHATGAGRAELGYPLGTASRTKIDELAKLLRAGGMTIAVLKDPWSAVWRKVATNAAVNPTTALLGRVNSDLLADPAMGLIADGLAREVARVATAAGVPVPEDDAVKWWREMAQLTGPNRSSMLQDVEAKRVTEVDAICGAVFREGQRRGVAAPLNQAMTLLVSALHPVPSN